MSHATVLIVDDEDLVRWSLRERMKKDGHAVIEAATAAAALDAAPGADLVLLDYRLPDGDGLSVLRGIKDQWPDTPVILMTAFSTVENAVDAMRLGGGLSLRVLRWAILVFNFAGGPDGFNFTMGQGFAF
jgi:DNA-binding NtrC family response regulator